MADDDDVAPPPPLALPPAGPPFLPASRSRPTIPGSQERETQPEPRAGGGPVWARRWRKHGTREAQGVATLWSRRKLRATARRGSSNLPLVGFIGKTKTALVLPSANPSVDDRRMGREIDPRLTSCPGEGLYRRRLL